MSLTRYPEGSLRELLALCLPLQINSFTTMIMIFVDRCFLAHYSADALNACVSAGTMSWAFSGGLGMVAGMSEIFVAQYNGARRYDKISVPVWQMFWLSLLSLLFFLPMGLWGGELLYRGMPNHDLMIQYHKPIMVLGFTWPLMVSLSGFFVGRGKTHILFVLAVCTNLVNMFLDWALIFGIKGWIPEMGVKGAAFATSFGYGFQAVVLLCLFLKKKNQEVYNTHVWKINWEILKDCLRVGVPQGALYALEWFGWGVFNLMMNSLGGVHATVSSICNSFFLLFTFYLDGLSRAVTALSGNFIGSKRYNLLSSLIRSGIFLQGLFVITLISLIPLNIKKILHFFMPVQVSFDIDSALMISIAFVILYIFVEGIRWVLSGILSSAGDTVFLLVCSSLSVWLCLILPVYLIVVRNNLRVETAWAMVSVYSALLAIFYYWRYKRGKWKNLDLILHHQEKSQDSYTVRKQEDPFNE